MVWSDVDYGYKKKITLNNVKIAGDEIDFPVLISVTDANLADEANGGHVKSASGYDIVFYNSAEDTLLKHEIELYTNTNGKLCFWVKIPSLSSSAPSTYIYAYYSKAGVIVDPSSTDTWDADYLGVYHFADDQDSTGNNYDLTEVGGISYVDSEVGKGADLDGAADYFTQADVLNGTFDDLSVEAYVYHSADALTGDEYIFQFKDSVPGDSQVRMHIDQSDGDKAEILEQRDGNTTRSDGTGDLSDNDYHFWGVRTVQNDNVYLYIDASLEDTDATTDNALNLASLNFYYIGNDETGSMYDGILDELRFSDVDRGANWMLTSNNTISSPATFLRFGAEETFGAEEPPSTGSAIYYHDGTNNVELQRDDISPVQMFNGTSVIGLKLGATDDADASPIHVWDGSAIKAILKMP